MLHISLLVTNRLNQTKSSVFFFVFFFWGGGGGAFIPCYKGNQWVDGRSMVLRSFQHYFIQIEPMK